jgi:hypothetical protein
LEKKKRKTHSKGEDNAFDFCMPEEAHVLNVKGENQAQHLLNNKGKLFVRETELPFTMKLCLISQKTNFRLKKGSRLYKCTQLCG